MGRCRNTPISVQRQLRQEANFGCCRCGHPLLDNAHIIPFHESHEFPPDDMLALCPTCHRMADKGEYSEKHLRQLKANPHNRTSISERFLIEGDDMILNLAGNRFINCPRILTINDFEIITMRRESDGYITLNLLLYDKFNNMIGIIDENKWTFDTTLLWDMEYKTKYLRIRNKPREISFEIKIDKNEVFISGELFYEGQPIIISKDELTISHKNFNMTMKGCTMHNASGNVFNLQLGHKLNYK